MPVHGFNYIICNGPTQGDHGNVPNYIDNTASKTIDLLCMNETNHDVERIAVIVTDIQGDFTQLKDGSLAVPDTGEDYVRSVEAATRRLKEVGFLIFGSQDWHPADHVSFHTTHPGTKPGDTIRMNNKTQTVWPPHCIQGTENARVIIDNNLFLAIVKKALHPGFDSYSAFRDEGGNETELDNMLRRNNVRKVVNFGLATDYCVKYTSLDGLRKGYRFIVIESLSRGITQESTAQAIKEMKSEGAVIMKGLDIERIKAL
jgi:nicotinamidase/pyrazinamidase